MSVLTIADVERIARWRPSADLRRRTVHASACRILTTPIILHAIDTPRFGDLPRQRDDWC